MRDFDYAFTPVKLLTPEMVQMLTKLHEYKGRQDILLRFHRELPELPEYITKYKEPAYQEAYRLLCDNYSMILPSPKEFLQIHRKLVSGSSWESAMKAPVYDDEDTFDLNLLFKKQTETATEDPEESGEQGISSEMESADETGGFRKAGEPASRYSHIRSAQLQRSGLRFREALQQARTNGIERVASVKEADPEEAVARLCDEFLLAWEEDRVDKLILIPMFLVDLTCIRPFEQENEAFCLLIALLLLLRAGYQTVRYVSLEELIEKSHLTYTNVLQASCEGWEEEQNHYSIFAAYFLAILSQACEKSEGLLKIPGERKQKKPDQIRDFIDTRESRVTKKEIMATFPDISKVTVERALTEMVKTGYITKVGAGPSTGYVKSDKS